MATPFDKYAAKGKELLHLLAEDMQASNEKAFRILKAVLHVLVFKKMNNGNLFIPLNQLL
jgi:hypothetical protein